MTQIVYGEWKYVPDLNFTGDDIFTIDIQNANGSIETSTINISVTPVNDIPEVQDYKVDTEEYQDVNGKIEAEDVDGDDLTYSIDSSPNHGIVQLESDGTWKYTPDNDYTGMDRFIVKISDGKGGSATSTITIEVIKKDLTLSGIIKDKETGNPVEGAIVKVFDLKGKEISSYTTGEDGQYRFEDLIENIYEVVVEHTLFSQNRRIVNISDEIDTDGVITHDFNMVNFTIGLTANPSTIIGDGESTTILTTEIKDKNGLAISGVEVTFDASKGSFPNGVVGTTDAKGKTSILFRSSKIEGINPQIIDVTATVSDPVRELYGENSIQMTFEPGVIKGVVTDNETGLPVKGAKVIVSKDFNNDGIVDFLGTQTTGEDGKYIIAVPKGNVQYDVSITKEMQVGQTTVEITSNQTANVDTITGAGNEEFALEKAATGIILSKTSSGEESLAEDYSKFGIEIFDDSGTKEENIRGAFNLYEE